VSRAQRQEGSGLILLMGVVATLAILGVSLVVLTTNTAHNTYTDRMRAKAFSVTEAALDDGMSQMAASWPAASGTGPDFSSSTAQAAFRAEFAAIEFPSPKNTSLPFARAWCVDDQANVNLDDPANASNITWDQGSPTDPNLPDNRMWLVAQGNVGPKSSRVVALIERVYFNPDMPSGIVLYCGGSLDSNGGGNNPKIAVEVPPADGVVTARAGGGFSDPSVTQTPPIQPLTGSAAGTLEDVFPASLRSALVGLAQAHGRYFTSTAAAFASPADPIWSPGGGVTGLCVIDVTGQGAQTLSLGPSGYNSEASPGILLFLGSDTINIDQRGHSDYWGIMYTDGNYTCGHGNPAVHGMVVAAGGASLIGTADLLYNQNVISKLSSMYTLNVRIVPNTWREVKPAG
jgi:hypothetical protein